MKILLISNMYPSADSPYFGVFVKKVADFLANNNIVVYSVLKKNRGCKKLFFYARWVAFSIYYALKEKPDLLYAHFVKYSFLPILFLPSSLKRKTIYNFHGTDAYLNKPLKWIIRSQLKKSSLIVVPSEFYKQFVAETFSLSNHKIYISPSGGVDCSMFKPDFSKIKPNKIGYVSSILKNKGWRLLLSAAKEIDTKLTISFIGSGIEENLLRNEIKNYDGIHQIEYLGPIDHKELAGYMQTFDVFVFPSCKESLGLVGIEAMACGVPVIGSDIKALRTYINDNLNGILYKVNEVNELQDAIMKYVSFSDEQKNKMRENARKTAEKKFDSKFILQSLENEMIKVLK